MLAAMLEENRTAVLWVRRVKRVFEQLAADTRPSASGARWFRWLGVRGAQVCIDEVTRSKPQALAAMVGTKPALPAGEGDARFVDSHGAAATRGSRRGARVGSIDASN